MAERGYDVRLFDAVPRLVEVARSRNDSAPHKLAECSLADARAIPAENESAAMVLMLGPLYHLVEKRDRERARAEARRVLQPGGVLVAAGMGATGIRRNDSTTS